MFDLTAHLTPDISWRKAGGAGGVTPAFQTDFTALSALPAGVSLSRASNAMVTDSTGNLTYAPNNLLLQSNNFGNAAWTKTNATVSSGVADPLGGTNATTITATGANAEVFQGVAVSTPGNYICAIWVRRRTGTGNVSLYTPRTDTTVVISITSTWTLFSTNGSIPSANGFCDFVLATSGDAIDVYAPTLSQVTYETSPRSADQVITTSSPYYGPRFDHAWNGSAWIATGLLIEEQRTNLLQYSEQLDNSVWNKLNVAVTSNATTAPDGASNADLMVPSASSNFHLIYNTNGSSGTTVVFTVFAKAGGYSKIALRESSTTGAYASFDLSGGTVLDSGAGASSPTIQSVGGGWYRLSMVYAGGAASTLGISILPNSYTSGDALAVWTADGTSGLYAWGAQLEASPLATSYIPTTTAAVTRSADIAFLTGAAQTAIGGSSVTAIIEFDTPPHSPPPSYYAGFDLTGGANQTEFWSDGKIYVGTSTGQLPLDTGLGALSPNTNYRYGLAWDGAGASACGNGGTVATGTYAAPSAFTNAFIGSNGTGIGSLNSHIRSMGIYTSRLSDIDLQAKSVVGAAF